jgi:hypothetical protein
VRLIRAFSRVIGWGIVALEERAWEHLVIVFLVSPLSVRVLQVRARSESHWVVG